MPAPDSTRPRLAAMALASSFALAASAQDQPIPDQGAEVPGGAIGPDEMVTADLSVLQVQLEYALDRVYEEGEDAGLFLGIANTGTSDEASVDVVGPDITDAAEGQNPVPTFDFPDPHRM